MVVLIAAVAWLYYQQWHRERETTRKAHFLNQVAHELRTPLTSIRLYAELAEMCDPCDTKLRQHLQVIMSECNLCVCLLLVIVWGVVWVCRFALILRHNTVGLFGCVKRLLMVRVSWCVCVVRSETVGI